MSWELVAIGLTVGVALIVIAYTLSRRHTSRDDPAEPEQVQDSDIGERYFCYISQRKVDQLYEQLKGSAPTEWSEIETIEQSRSAKGEAEVSLGQIMRLFSVGGSYGRKDVRVRDMQKRITYVSRLDVVLRALAASSQICDLTSSRRPDGPSLYYHYTGEFSLLEPEGDLLANTTPIVTLVTYSGDRQLLLDCSTEYFSEQIGNSESYQIHSSNAAFFRGDVSVNMETVFLLLGAERSEIRGSPLFLAVHPGLITL